MPVNKSQVARDMLRAGDMVGALRIVKDFRLMTPVQRRFITRAWAVRQNPSLYRVSARRLPAFSREVNGA